MEGKKTHHILEGYLVIPLTCFVSWLPPVITHPQPPTISLPNPSPSCNSDINFKKPLSLSHATTQGCYFHVLGHLPLPTSYSLLECNLRQRLPHTCVSSEHCNMLTTTLTCFLAALNGSFGDLRALDVF